MKYRMRKKNPLHNSFARFAAAVILLALPAAAPLNADSTPQTPAAHTPTAHTIVMLGDSLTAGYGLAEDAAPPAQIESRLHARGHNVRIDNAGVSGDTSTGGLARLDWTLSENPDGLILELGSNDALRGLSPDLTAANLEAIVAACRARGIPVLLVGMLAPPNLGPEYEAAFNGMYPALAKRFNLVLYPFFLDGVAAEPTLNQADGMHPTAAGVEIIAERLTPYVEQLITQIESASPAEPQAESPAEPQSDTQSSNEK